jgi:MFS family permease
LRGLRPAEPDPALRWRLSLPAPSAPVTRLIGARACRSIGQGALVTVFSLYARHLGWGAALIGAVFAAGMLFNATLAGALGPLSDRLGRKYFLLGYEALSAAACLVALAGAAREPLAAAAIIGGFGRGSNGAAGAFAPVEQSWIAGLLSGRALGRILSINAATGFFGMAAGALLAGQIGATRLIFLLPLLGSLAGAALISATPDPPRPPVISAGHEAATIAGERKRLWQLAGLNLLNGTGIGLAGPFVTWWFAARFGASPAAIGPAMALAYGAAGASNLLAGRAGSRIGMINTILLMRGLALAAFLVMPFMPSFALAAGAFILRSGLNSGTAGARQAMALGLVRSNRRGLAASINMLSVQLPRAVSPAFAGLIFATGALALPFVLAAAFQGAYLLLYPLLFTRATAESMGPPRSKDA